MSKKTTKTGALGTRLSTEKFHALTATLAPWRLDPEIRLMDAKGAKGRILAFVKGLRLSARVAYLVRGILSGEEVEVSWGHLVDESGNSCSPECDIIIHRPGSIEQWNGDGGREPIMDFKFIECANALAVISCKSFAKSVDKKYCGAFAKYGLEDIMLFAECCLPIRTASLKKQALAAGYSGFYYLYTIAKDDYVVQQDETVYLDFANAVRNLASPSPPPRRRAGRKSTK